MQKRIEWGLDKNELLKAHRGVSFEDVLAAIESGDVLEKKDNPSPKYPHQKMYIVRIRNYAYAVPYIESNGNIFLKTIFPSHKYTKRYLK
jgi:uncharacterized DUF497 family protein